MPELFFTADPHFGHSPIRHYASRAFNSIEEMDSNFIDEWNKVVTKRDTVYVNGDFTWHKEKEALRLFHALKGSKHLIIGNHDWATCRKLPWCSQEKIKYLKVKRDDKNTNIVICHFALRVWAKSHYGAWHLFGHSHGRLAGIENSVDVGVDMAYKKFGVYRPFSFEEVSKYIEENNIIAKESETVKLKTKLREMYSQNASLTQQINKLHTENIVLTSQLHK